MCTDGIKKGFEFLKIQIYKKFPCLSLYKKYFSIIYKQFLVFPEISLMS